jgi:replicative DNA helicase
MTIHAIADTKTEEQLLSHCFSSPDELDNRKLKPELFTLPKHRQLFEAMRKLRQQGEPISADGVRLIDATLEDVAKKLSLRRLGELTTRTVVAKLCEMEKRRAMQEVAAQLAEAATGSENPDEAISEQLSRLMAREGDDETRSRKLGDVEELIDVFQWKSDNPGAIRGMSTGYAKLDKICDGLHPGLIALGGKTSDGKSTFALNVLLRVAEILRDKGDKRACWLGSFEMQAIDVQLRAASRLSGYPLSDGGLTHAQMSELTRAVKLLKSLNVVIDDKSHPKLSWVVSRIRKLHREQGLALAILDYGQLVRWDKSKGDTTADNNQISKAIQALSLELRIPIIVVVMLRRPEKTWDKKLSKWFIPPPTTSDIKSSGAWEEDAAAVWLIHRDMDNNTKLTVSKNRWGRRDVDIDLKFSAAIYGFDEI